MASFASSGSISKLRREVLLEVYSQSLQSNRMLVKEQVGWHAFDWPRWV